MLGSWPSSPSPQSGMSRHCQIRGFLGKQADCSPALSTPASQCLAHFRPDTLPGTKYLKETVLLLLLFCSYRSSSFHVIIASLCSGSNRRYTWIPTTPSTGDPECLTQKHPWRPATDVSAELCPGSHHHCDLMAWPRKCHLTSVRPL